MKLSALKSHERVLNEQLRDTEFRTGWERTALARAVALLVTAERAKHRWTQQQLANHLGIKQPAVARLESGEHTPSLQTVLLLAEKLGIEFLLHVAPAQRRSRLVGKNAERAAVVERATSRGGAEVLVAGE